MCDQSEITYHPNEIVWVKLGPVWWPGEVQDYNALPQEITANFRKQPIAVVKFFQEDSYEYIKNLNHIYRYNCLKKNEFIKKGLDLCRSANVREVPSNMKMFPEDIVTAEKRTGGNPNILLSEQFAPQQKKSYIELFGTPKKSKEGKDGSGSGRRGRPPSEPKANLKSFQSTSASAVTPSLRSITHPRFVGHSNTPDYESRVRQQPPPDSETDPPNLYKCHICNFSTVRLNVIVLHNKSHTGTNVNFSPKDKEITAKKSTPRVKLSTPKIKQTGEAIKRKLVTESPSVPKRANVNQTASKKEIEKPSPSSVTPEVDLKPVSKKRGPKSTKTEKLAKVIKENEMIRDDLLKDWDDEDEMAEEEEKSKQFEDKSFLEMQSSDSEKEKENTDQKTELETSEEVDEKAKEKSCFDFDESEDSAISHEKPISFSRKASTVVLDGPSASVSEKKVDLEVEEFGKKVDDLLSETVVPKLPDLKLSRASSKNSLESLKFDENAKSNKNESESFDSSVAEGNLSVAYAKITDGSHSFGGLQNSSSETATQSTNQKDESKLTQREADVKLLPSTKSLVIDFDSKPIRQRRRSSQPKSESQVVTDCPVKSEASLDMFVPTEESVTSSESVALCVPKCGRPPIETLISTNTITRAAESISAQENIGEVELVADPIGPHVTSCKTEPADEVSSSSDQIVAELVPTIKEEALSPNEVLSSSSAEVKLGAAAGTARGTGKRGRPPGSRQVTLRRGMPQQTAASIVTSTRRRSTLKKGDDNFTAPTSLMGQEIEVNSSSAVNFGQEMIVKKEARSDSKPVSTISLDVSSTGLSQLSIPNVISDSVVGETIVIGGDLVLNPEQPAEVNSDPNAVTANCNLDFDISSMPIVIDNNEYAPSSAGYEKVETVQTFLSTPMMEIASSVAPVNAEPKTTISKSPSSFLEKALIRAHPEVSPSSDMPSLASSDPNSSRLKSVVSAMPKRTVAVKTEKGSISKSIMPAQTSGGPTKLKTVKMPSSKLLTHSSKSPNQFLLVKTSTGQQLVNVKSSQFFPQPDGKVVILTQNQSPRSGLVVKNVSKGEQLAPGKFTPSRLIRKVIGSSSGDDTEDASSSKQASSLLNKVGGECSKSKILAGASGASQGGTRQKILSKISGVTVSSGVTLSQGNSSTKKVILPGKQIGVSKVFLSKAGAPGTKFVMHSSPTKVRLPPSMRQKLMVCGGSPGNILVPSPVRPSTASTMSVQGSAGKVIATQVSSSISSPVATVSKVVKVQKQGPNILQKQQRKSSKTMVTGALPSKVVTAAMTSVPSRSLSSVPTDPAATPSTSEAVANSSGSVTPNVVYVAMDNNTYQAVDSSMLTFDASQQPTQTLYINPGTTNLENILLTIDEKGNVNLAQQTPQLFTSEVATPTQDILAKALADTQVLQTEASIADATGRVAYMEPLPYPAPPLISNVHETSLTLNQPIMTPLEVPSSVTPIASNFSLIAPEQSAEPVKSSSQDMFITQIPGVPASDVAFQITVDDNLVATSAGLNQIPSSNSIETNIDEDLIKINKPLKSNSVDNEDKSCMKADHYLTETDVLENKNEMDASKFIVSEMTGPDCPVQPNFIDSKETLSDVLPDSLSVSSNGQNELIIPNESSNFENDRCDSLKTEISEDNCILETEIVNGLSSDCGDNNSPSKVTKELDFPCQESEKTSNETLLAPSDTILHLSDG